VFYCSTCEADFDCEGSTDDWNLNAYADCPNCGTELEKELADPAEEYWADFDPEK
jgi:DNA-directed RNA polymerase subunit RPC12/RpoP